MGYENIHWFFLLVIYMLCTMAAVCVDYIDISDIIYQDIFL